MSLSHFPEVMKKKNLGAYSASNSSSSSATSSSSRSKDRSTKERSREHMKDLVTSSKRSAGKDGTIELKLSQDIPKDETNKKDGRPIRRKEEVKTDDGPAAAPDASVTEKKELPKTVVSQTASDESQSAEKRERIKREGSRKIENISFAIDATDKSDSATGNKPSSPRLARPASPRSYTRSVSSPRLSANTIVRTSSSQTNSEATPAQVAATSADQAGQQGTSSNNGTQISPRLVSSTPVGTTSTAASTSTITTPTGNFVSCALMQEAKHLS